MGTKITFLDPKPEQIRIQEITWHLARTCRFNGLMLDWYSNAEHSMMGARMASNKEIARQFLVHDAGEYVFADVPSPVGRLVPQYQEMKHKFELYLLTHFTGALEFDPEVKEIDYRICATEQKWLRNGKSMDVQPYPSLSRRDFKCYSWYEAYKAYLDVFGILFPEYKDA